MINYKDLNLTEEELDELQKQLNLRSKQQQYEENLQAIEEHKSYIGKCYFDKEKDQYIRVLSSKSTNQFRFECMIFSFPIKIKEEKRKTLQFSPDNAFSNILWKGIHIEDYPLLCSHPQRGKILHVLTEIDENEYFKKMDEYNTLLKEAIKNGIFDTTK